MLAMLVFNANQIEGLKKKKRKMYTANEYIFIVPKT